MITQDQLDAALEELMERGPRHNPEHDESKRNELDQFLGVDLNKAMMWYLSGVGDFTAVGHFATGLSIGLLLGRQESLNGSSDPDDTQHTYERDPE